MTSISYRRSTYLEFCPTRASWFMKKNTTSKYNFVILKFGAKDMNKFQQAFSGSEEVWQDNVLWTAFRSLIALRRKHFWGVCVKLCKLRKSNIVPPPTTTKVQFEVVIQKTRTNTYKRTTRALSLKFTYPTWIVDNSWGVVIY